MRTLGLRRILIGLALAATPPAALAVPSVTPLPRPEAAVPPPVAAAPTPIVAASGIPRPIPAPAFKTVTGIFAAAERGDWQTARARAATAPATVQVALTWAWLRSGPDTIGYDAYDRFLDTHSTWPHLDTIQRRAEQALWHTRDHALVRRAFTKRAPITGRGMIRFGEALIDGGERGLGADLIRTGYRDGRLTRAEVQQTAQRHRALLTAEDHEARLDRLLWQGQGTAARAVMRYVGADWRALAEARLALRAQAAGVDGAVRRVPAHLSDHPGLTFERAKWRRRKGRHEDAWPLIAAMGPPPGPVAAAAMWRERSILANDAVEAGAAQAAYDVVAQHGLTRGADFAGAEFLAGWIALTQLDDPDTAIAHFATLYKNVSFPISVSRGAYWLARAHLAKGELDVARTWFRTASRHDATYYGQLARVELTGRDSDPAWVPHSDPTAPTGPALDLELAQAATLFVAVGWDRTARLILRHMVAQAGQNPDRLAAVADFADRVGGTSAGVDIAKRASYVGVDMLARTHPIVDLDRVPTRVEPALVHAIIRQESLFDPTAGSHKGAQGLMQLLPSTARNVARSEGIGYARERLFDPDYNIRLGAAYLHELLRRYDGSYTLAIAAYNAGPRRIDRWLTEFGDPRRPEVDPVDWVEKIPFGETRNYVQRVLENLQVYRARLSDDGPVALLLHHDLRRGSSVPGTTYIAQATDRTVQSE